ncbi:hypothetical protein Cabys_2981 [Caldithrix abyssi DSM 13497]|uniref:Uncharacterized protein n=1 Tax=Caldithrix abyssi DSM 13497 TaxID=880073 RepID=A0A1J1CBT2_CALAY|nr:hypothetical protein Cabys_2981 [Caldithrix abyssi DSM 13497]
MACNRSGGSSSVYLKNRTFWVESAFVNAENLNKSIEMMKLQTICGVQT